MNARTARMIEAEGAAALLDGGVSVPLKELRLPLRKKPVRLRVVMRRPRLGGLIRLAKVYLKMGVTAAEMEKFTKEEEMAFIASHAWDCAFYEHYQVGGADEPDEAEAEPRKEGELRTVYEKSHSPFGFVWQIAAATGWSTGYILEGVNYQTLIMMLADAPRYVRKKSGGKSAEDEAAEIVGFFQSNLEK